MIHVHPLKGCAPAPLAHYLKALGLLRLVSEQADPGARGWWEGDHFALATRLSATALERFLLEDYRPTPLIAPWNGGSGFYPKDNSTGIEPIEHSTHPRFAPYREVIALGRRVTAGRERRPNAGPEKLGMLEWCRAQWPPEALPWMDAAAALIGDDLAFPALLGTGGNDGRLDFTNNFMQRLAGLFPGNGKPANEARGLLLSALYGAATQGLLANAAVGQFLPGGAGGMNAGPGFDAKSLLNPWDFVLMLEGAVAFQVASVRQLDSTRRAQIAAPFAMRAQATGYGSASRSEESARGEQWMPLWRRPMRHVEVRSVLREGRLRDSRGGASRPVKAAMALAAHGAARGITAFQRFVFVERNGLSNLAVDAGRIEVRPSQAPRLLDEIEGWVQSLRRASSDPVRDPESLRRQVRQLEDSMLGLVGDCRPARVRELLIRLGEADAGLSLRPQHTASRKLGPLSGLSAAWVAAADDGSPEFRLALACATQWVPGEFDPKTRGHAFRAYMHPLATRDRFALAGGALAKDARVVWSGHDLVRDLIAVVRRRSIESDRSKASGLGLRPGRAGAARLADVQRFVLGRVDDVKLAALLRGLAGLSLGKADQVALRSTREDALPVFPPLALVRLAVPTWDIPSLRIQQRVDARLLEALATGSPRRAGEIASRRLTAWGLRPRLSQITADHAQSRRLAASLGFPLSESAHRRLADALTFRRVAEPTGDA